MTNDRSVSVIIPTYNRAAVVSRAIDSAVTAADGFDFEVIVIDDASSDIEELREVVARYPQVRLIEKPDRVNAAHSRRIGFDASVSDYVFFLDSDDEYEPSHIANRYELMSKSPFSFVFGNYNLLRNGQRKPVAIPKYEDDDMREYLFVRKGTFLSSTLTVNKRNWRGVMFDGIWNQHQDWALGISAADGGERIGFDQHAGVSLHDDAPGRMGRYSSIDACRQFCDLLLNDFPSYKNTFVLGQMYRSLRNNSSNTFFELAAMLDKRHLRVAQRVSVSTMGAALRIGLAGPLVSAAKAIRRIGWRLRSLRSTP